MVDTVVLKVMDLKKNYKFIDALRKRKAGKQNISGYRTMEDTFGKFIRGMDIIFNEGSGKIIENWKFKSIPSSTYEVNCFICEAHDVCRINMSVPKYAYGHNVRHIIDKRSLATTIEGAYLDVYKELVRILKSFFEVDIGAAPDYSDVRLERIDVCYNSFLKSEQECEYVMSRMRNIRPKGMRINSARYSDYHTTLMMKYENHSDKVYQKGKEFRRNQLAILKGAGIDTSRIEKEADRCLRFEITYRAGGLSYYYRRDRIRKVGLDSIFNLAEDGQREWIMAELSKKKGVTDLKKLLLLNGIDYSTPLNMKRATRWVLETILKPAKQTVDLRLKHPDPEEVKKFEGHIFYFPKVAEFTPDFLRTLLHNLETFVKDMQPVKVSQVAAIPKALKKYYEQSQRFSDNELEKLGIYAHQTILNKRSQLKKYLKIDSETYRFVKPSDFHVLG